MEESSTKQKQTPVRKITTPAKQNPKHWLDRKNAIPFIVAVLFITTLICYVVVVCVKGTISDNTLGGFKDLLLVLGSVFTGTQLRK